MGYEGDYGGIGPFGSLTSAVTGGRWDSSNVSGIGGGTDAAAGGYVGSSRVTLADLRQALGISMSWEGDLDPADVGAAIARVGISALTPYAMGDRPIVSHAPSTGNPDSDAILAKMVADQSMIQAPSMEGIADRDFVTRLVIGDFNLPDSDDEEALQLWAISPDVTTYNALMAARDLGIIGISEGGNIIDKSDDVAKSWFTAGMLDVGGEFAYSELAQKVYNQAGSMTLGTLTAVLGLIGKAAAGMSESLGIPMFSTFKNAIQQGVVHDVLVKGGLLASKSSSDPGTEYGAISGMPGSTDVMRGGKLEGMLGAYNSAIAGLNNIGKYKNAMITSVSSKYAPGWSESLKTLQEAVNDPNSGINLGPTLVPAGSGFFASENPSAGEIQTAVLINMANAVGMEFRGIGQEPGESSAGEILPLYIGKLQEEQASVLDNAINELSINLYDEYYSGYGANKDIYLPKIQEALKAAQGGKDLVLPEIENQSISNTNGLASLVWPMLSSGQTSPGRALVNRGVIRSSLSNLGNTVLGDIKGSTDLFSSLSVPRPAKSDPTSSQGRIIDLTPVSSNVDVKTKVRDKLPNILKYILRV